ncbi:MAG: glucose-6-phosphate isomerase family protein [Bacillota bacterium]
MIWGTDFILTEKGQLAFAEGIIHPSEPEMRTIKDALPVLYHSAKPYDKPLYYIYRNIYKKVDEDLFKEYNLRYDITVLHHGKVGKEYIKTIGHFHPLKNTCKETYPEYYEVLSGEAIFLLQRNGRNNEVEEVIAVEAKKDDKVFIPPNYGHITINTGEQFLVVANLIATCFQSLYDPFLEKSGAAYYYIESEKGKGDWVKNPSYKNSVGLKIKAAPNFEQAVAEVKNKSIYDVFVERPESFKMLTD